MHLKPEEKAWRGDPLPRGRHKLARGAVRSSQRERLLRAMVECVAQHGFESTSVPMVVATARVSSNAFYEFFTDKTDCFLTACDDVARELLQELGAMTSEPDWIAAMRKGAGLYLRWWQQRPAFARAYLLSLQSVGERALEQRERTYALFRAMFADLGRRARAEQPALPPLPELVPRILVITITELLAEEVRAGRIDTLDRLERDLAHFAIRMLADDATASSALGDGGRWDFSG
jgi:AcrR family transcriptional regulator